jgi:hypothetical protein
MKNPWTKKNPYMSMWLSGANAMTGAARGRASAAAKRQAQTAMNEGMKQALNFWSGAWLLPAPPKKRKQKR